MINALRVRAQIRKPTVAIHFLIDTSPRNIHITAARETPCCRRSAISSNGIAHLTASGAFLTYASRSVPRPPLIPFTDARTARIRVYFLRAQSRARVRAATRSLCTYNRIYSPSLAPFLTVYLRASSARVRTV